MGDHMIQIRALSPHDSHSLPGLCHLLMDAVAGGASVGFLAPLSYDTAFAYWQQVLASIGEGLCVWSAEDRGQLVGSVQLALCQKQNGAHRAEILKLLVLSTSRGQGVAKGLMQVAEAHACAQGRSLGVLDTEAGSIAETVYRRLGWQKAGEIPDFAASPEGVLRPTALYYKRLSEGG